MNVNRFPTRIRTYYRVIAAMFLAALFTQAAAQDIQCTNLQPIAITGTPTQAQTLHGIPTDWLTNTVFATISPADELDPIPVYIELTDPGVAEFIVPLHPDNYMGGGTVQLTIYNAEFGEYCDPIELTITPLTPAPAGKTIADLSEAMEQVLTERMQFLGYDDTNIASFDPQHDPFGFSMAATLAMLQNETLQALTHDSAIMLGEETHDLNQELASAMAYTSGYTDAMFAFLDEFAKLPDLPINTSTEATLAHVQGGGSVPPLPQNISTPEELDWWMEARTNCTVWNNIWLRGPREAAGGMAAAASLIPGTQVITAAAFAHLTLSQMTIDICSNLIPHRFAAFEVTASPGVHNEDGSTTGRWSAEVTAVGIPYTIDWPTVLGAVPGLGITSAVVTKFSHHLSKALVLWTPVAELISGIIFDVWGIHTTTELYTLEPLNPAPFNVDPNRPGEHKFIEWEVVTLEGDRPFTLNPRDPLEYQAREVGVAQVWVRTKADKFQGEFAGGHAILRMRPIEIEIGRPGYEEGPYFLEPGQTIELEAVVFNAEDPSLEWSATAGEIEMLGELYVKYTAPMESAYVVVQAESLSRGGLRASGVPSRSGWVEIVVVGLSLSPSKACVPLGSSQQLRAMYTFGEEADFDNLVVIEHGTAGHVSGNTFHATSEGTMSVEVYDRDFPDLAATAEFTVRAECDAFTAIATGAIEFHTKGQCLARFNQTAYFNDGTRYMEFALQDRHIEALLEGEVDHVEFETRVSGTIPNAAHPSFAGWGSDWVESGERAVVSLTGAWRSETFLLDEEGFPYTTKLFTMNGSISGPVAHIEPTSEGLILMTSHVTIDFVGLTDAWGDDDLFWGYEFDEFCFDAMPFGWND